MENFEPRSKKRGEKMKKWKILLLLLLVAGVMTACSSKKEGDIETKIFNLEADFKENYQLWVDMKADGSIQYKEYALDIKSVGSKFKSIGNKANLSSYKKLLSQEDQTIYKTYGGLGGKIHDLGHALYYGKKEKAKELYDEILDAEEKLKE